MRTSIWYSADEKTPPKSDYYLAFKGMSMGDDETKCGYYYWDARRAEWRDSRLSQSYYANVVYWTDADPGEWYENYSLRQKSKMMPAEQDAWNAVLEAIEKYEVVKALCERASDAQ